MSNRDNASDLDAPVYPNREREWVYRYCPECGAERDWLEYVDSDLIGTDPQWCLCGTEMELKTND